MKKMMMQATHRKKMKKIKKMKVTKLTTRKRAMMMATRVTRMKMRKMKLALDHQLGSLPATLPFLKSVRISTFYFEI
jgi:hypothetical protein